MVSDLRSAFSIPNLRRAWQWLKTSGDASYKNYFRHIYRAYAIADEANLKMLRERLIKGMYEPTHATKIYHLKKSGIQRTITLLGIEDQIVYQALVNIIADQLFPVIKHRYHKEVFGNLLAGPRSKFFYVDWHKGYKHFSAAIRKIYDQGFVYTATFDLTAFYDSIDHAVLAHFLAEAGIQKEFIDLLCRYLKHWTARFLERRIYHGHGIPQGPPCSGFLSEVVLKYFDDRRPVKHSSWRYFRYVDDIRLFAKNEQDLRVLLVKLDLISKEIGLFPQTGKINIHKVKNIADEIKSISNPPEVTVGKASEDQDTLRRRINKLSPRYVVLNETRFKYVIGSAEPHSALSNRLIAVLRKRPHLYISVFHYLNRYKQFPEQLSRKLLDLLTDSAIYTAFVAAGLRSMRDRCHPYVQLDLNSFARTLIDESEYALSPELNTAAIEVLLVQNALSWEEILEHVRWNPEWWARSELIHSVDIRHYGKPSFEFLIKEFLVEAQMDVSIVAAELAATHDVDLGQRTYSFNPIAQIAFRKMGLISVVRSGRCPITNAMRDIFGVALSRINWKKLFGYHYKYAISKVIRLRAYSAIDASSWVNLLDTLHDDLLDSLFINEAGAIGTYTHGNIGGALASSTSRFALKFPVAQKVFSRIHEKRLESSLSHSVVRKTGRRTRFIEFEFINKTKSSLVRAYLEIWSNWI
jgi:reverse transcriptase-like protein